MAIFRVIWHCLQAFFCVLVGAFFVQAHCSETPIILAQANTKSASKSTPKSSATKNLTTKQKNTQTRQKSPTNAESKQSKNEKSPKSKNTNPKNTNAKEAKDSSESKNTKQNQQPTSQAPQPKSQVKLPYSKKELKGLDDFLESLPKYTQKQLQELQKEKEIFALANHTQTTQESKSKALKAHCQKGSAIACSSSTISNQNPNDFQKAQKMLQKECEAKPPNARSGLYCARLADKYLIGKSKQNAFEKSCQLGEPLGCIGALSGKINSKKRKKYIIIAHAISENLCENGEGIYCGVVASVLNFKLVGGAEYYAKKGCEKLHDRLTCLILERLENKPKSMRK